MRTFLSFIFTIGSYFIVLFVRKTLALLRRIPLVPIALFLISEACLLIFDFVFKVSGFVIATYKKELKHYTHEIAIINDVKLNVSGKYILNALMTRKETASHLKFGNKFSTVSDTMGRVPNMPPFGLWSKDVFLDSIEDDHCAKAVELNNKALIKRVKELGL
mgnify:CR=1 FL=1